MTATKTDARARRMKCKPARWVRDLAPITLSPNREIRLAVVETNGHQRLTMATWARGDTRWVKLPGDVSVPTDLIWELHNRLNAALC